LDFGFWILDFGLPETDHFLQSKIQNLKSKIDLTPENLWHVQSKKGPSLMVT